MTENFFFDTCTLIKINKNNLKDKRRIKDIELILTKPNILEFFYFLIKKSKKEEISKGIKKLNKYAIKYNNKILTNRTKINL